MPLFVVGDLFFGFLDARHHGLHTVLSVLKMLSSIIQVALHGRSGGNCLKTESLFSFELGFEVGALSLEELRALQGLVHLFHGLIALFPALVTKDGLGAEHRREQFRV